MGKKRVLATSFRIGLIPFTSLLLIFIPPLFNTNITTRADSFLGDRHLAKGLSCASCHKEDPPKNKVPNSMCMTCHQDEGKLAERTNKVVPNPHASPHLDPGTAPACDECHHIHKPSQVACIQCHPDFKFRNL